LPINAPDRSEPAPLSFNLDAAYPNPFNSRTVVLFTLENVGHSRLGLYDLSGREVISLVDGLRSAGHYIVSIDAGTIGLTSGIYYLKLVAGEQVAGQKVLYLR